ncbi:hypothetical protein [Qipengyuania flava]|uniref:hypothetical protein n=1 Tax=Qipengyuania flava TaxID=192812 RepID=UPI003BB04EDC
MESCDILIDTNIALHFPRIDQLDWPDLAGCRTCTILIAPILLRELEQKKIFGATTAIKERAGRTIDYLVERMAEADPIHVRPNVTLVFLEHEPGIDFEANLLVREMNDDQYIASAIEHAAKVGSDTRIASNDGGMALKLRSRPISVLRLPDELRLPLERDPRDKELRETKAQLLQLQTQRPKLVTTFAGGSRKREIRNAKALPTRIPTTDEIKVKHAPLPLPPHKQKDRDSRFSGNLVAFGGLRGTFGESSALPVERYNEELTQFYAKYSDYASRMARWLEYFRLSATIELELHNSGSATATDVDVTLRFPEGISLCRPRDFPDEPKEPVPPQRPGQLAKSSRNGLTLDVHRLPHLDLNVHDGAVEVNEQDRTVRFYAKSLKQKCVLRVDDFILTRLPSMAARGIEVDVEMTLHETEPVHQKLAITFVETDAVESDD